MKGKIIHNKLILSEYWSSNTPNQIKAFQNGLHLVDNITCGILIVKDINTKEIEAWYGITNYIDKGEKVKSENRELLLQIGNKLNINDFINFINEVKKEEK